MNEWTWTREQEAVLASTSRVTLVRAGPGSGKTKVFVERLNRYLNSWQNRHGGIAALSFTNVAQDEIATRLGGRLPAPHFVGTLDSFFLRFVVGPFGHVGGIKSSGARLIPSPLDLEIRKPSFDLRTQDGGTNPIPLFHIGPCGGAEGSPKFIATTHYGGRERIPDERIAEVHRMKTAEWAARGRITHADSHYLAASIIRGPHCDAVRKLLARRFPVVLVDELQDTGHFLSRALLSLLAEASITAVLVGDEDQRIFGFSGVDPQFFKRVGEIEGCKDYPLRITQRCAARVAAVASALARSEERVEPKADAREGAAVLLVHDDPKGCRSPRSLQEAAALCRKHECKNLAVLVRKRDEKRFLLGLDLLDECPLKSRGPRALHKAVILLREGHGDQAARIVESRLGHLVLENEAPHRDDLEQGGVDPAEFRRRARKLVLQAAQFPSGENWGQWSDRMKVAVEQAAIDLGGNDIGGRLGGMFKRSNGDRADLSRAKTNVAPGSWRDGLIAEVITIHEAKGREFDAVLLYCSRPSKYRGISTCPSENWWSEATDSEEREVAFVAATRAKHLFILSVHSESFEALQKKRPDFVALFDRN